MLSSMKKTQTRERFRPMDSTLGGPDGEEGAGRYFPISLSATNMAVRCRSYFGKSASPS